jgi:citronellol/citronellal dehydrogenase
VTDETSFGRTDDALAAMPLPFAEGLFSGQVVLISGAGTGIGRAAAHWFARLGADLMLCGRSSEKLTDAARALERYGSQISTHALSIREPDAVDALFETVWRQFGRLDVVVNNAGGQFPQAAIDFTPKGWQAVIDTNLTGTWYMMQAAARTWRDGGVPGAIVNVVAVVDRGMPGIAHTAAARAGVIHVAKTVAVEWAPLGIRVNCVAPGVTSTEGMHVYPEEARARFARTNPLMRFGQVEEMANAICYLSSSAAAFITGEVLAVDGGNRLWGDQWTIPRPAYFND